MIIKEWQGRAIEIREDARINLTSMALACGKTTKHTENWLITSKTKELIKAAENQGGLAQPPWKTREVAIETHIGRGGRWAIRPIAIAYAMDYPQTFTGRCAYGLMSYSLKGQCLLPAIQ